MAVHRARSSFSHRQGSARDRQNGARESLASSEAVSLRSSNALKSLGETGIRPPPPGSAADRLVRRFSERQERGSA